MYKELSFNDVATLASFNPLSARRNHKGLRLVVATR